MRALLPLAFAFLLPAAAVMAQVAPAEPGGFRKLERAPTPGEVRAAQIEEQRRLELVRECKARRSRGEKVGIALGTVAGIAAGLLVAEPGNDSEQVIASTLGAGVGATAGALIGEGVDPRDPCNFNPPDQTGAERQPAIPTDHLHRPPPARTIGAGPEPLPGRGSSQGN